VKLFEHQRAIQLDAIKSLQKSNMKYDHKYKLTETMVKDIFRVRLIGYFFVFSEIWNIFSRNMIKCHIFSWAGMPSENVWHFIMLSENIDHISRKMKK
jgi:hypothetical protein